MPWVLEETFAAGGLDLHSEVTLRRLDPLYRIRWAGERAPLRLHATTATGCARRSRASRARDAGAASTTSSRRSRPIYERRHPRRRPARRSCAPATSRGSCRRMVRLGALRPLHRFVARYFEHPRVREAFSFHSLFIGGDPYRVPAIYGALVYLQVLDGGWYADGGVYSLVEAMARPLDVRCGARGGADRARAAAA